MEGRELIISPKELYPTESLASIKNDTLQFYVESYTKGEEVESPFVFYFYGNYYIFKGHHIVLAAILAREEKIKAEVIDVKNISFWKEEENIKSTLKSIGKSTLYDFETIGNFTYNSYPHYYEKDC